MCFSIQNGKRHKMQKHSFPHTFRAKIKHGRLKKGGASTANPKKEHHHGLAVCHVILAYHPRCHRHCPLRCRRHCSPANLVTISITLPPSPSLSLATLITSTVFTAAIALVVAHPAPLSSLLLATLIATTVIAAAIALVVARPAPSSHPRLRRHCSCHHCQHHHHRLPPLLPL
jgi:hypothetical protein